MKTVAILVPERSVLQTIADSQNCFYRVNRFLSRSGRKPLFNIKLVGAKKTILLNNASYSVHPQKLISEVNKTDLVIIPALAGNVLKAIDANSRFIPWIINQYKNGSEIASLCVGAFLLAATGLLNGKKCSTHWGFTDKLKGMFPEVIVQEGSIITEENGIYTSGGANSYWNLLLHLVEKYTDRETAIYISKYFAIDINRNSQSVFAIFNGQKDHDDNSVRKAQEYIEKKIDEKITVADLAVRVALHRRSLERRFRQATGNSVLEYIQRVKMEAAKRSFETTRKNINEVMYEVGYTDTKAFRSTFRKITGLTPVEYRSRYNKISTK
jgi:transcriptional regulator GlxA family with amidase domain